MSLPLLRGGGAAAIWLCIASSMPAHAAESSFRIVSAFTVQEKTSEFTLADTPIDSTQTTYNFLIGASRDRFYVIAELERPFSQDVTAITASTPRQFIVDREDSALTAGYNVWQRLNVFVGYKTGTTSIQIMPSGASTEALQFEYREKGSFVGASYGFDFDAHGQLSVSLAYADLPTTLSRKSLRSGDKESTKGNTTGTSYAVKWTGTFTEGVDYSIGYKQSNYQFDDQEKNLDGKDSETKQTYKTFFVGLTKVF